MPNAKQDFLNIIEANKRIIFKICNAYCQNADDREDLAQEMIYQLWKSWSSFNTDFKRSTWMYRVALNVAISFYRKEKKNRDLVLMGDHVIELADENLNGELEANIQVLQKFINQLNTLDKALMILYLEEKPHQEIAEIMGISSSNVATKIGRIKEQLKQKFLTQS